MESFQINHSEYSPPLALKNEALAPEYDRLKADEAKLEEIRQAEEAESLQAYKDDDNLFTMLPLYPKQEAIVKDPARFTYCEATTKAGKTMSHIEWQLKEMSIFKGGNHWWVAQVGGTADIAYRRAKLRLRGKIDSSGELKQVADPIPFEFLDGKKVIKVFGALWWFKGGDNPDSLFGEDVYTLVGDEFSRWKPASWTACYTTLTATKGRAKLIGNVKKEKSNFAYKIARKAEKGLPNWSYHKLTSYDAVEGGVVDAAEVEQARIDLPPEEFKALYLAEASDAGGTVFKELKYYFERPKTGRRIFGMDAAYSSRKSADRSVLIEAIEVIQDYKQVDGSIKRLPFYYVVNIWFERTTAELWFPKVKMRAGNNVVFWKGSGTEKGTAGLGASSFNINLNFQTTQNDKLSNAVEAVVANNQGRILFPDPDIFPDTREAVEEAEEEITGFTGVEKNEIDDIVDALANMVSGKTIRSKASR